MKRMKRNEEGLTQKQKDLSEKRRRDYPVQAVIYDNAMDGIDHAQYPFPQALKKWGKMLGEYLSVNIFKQWFKILMTWGFSSSRSKRAIPSISIATSL